MIALECLLPSKALTASIVELKHHINNWCVRNQPHGDDGIDLRSQIGTDNSATMQLDVALPPQCTFVPVHQRDIPDPSLTVFPPTNVQNAGQNLMMPMLFGAEGGRVGGDGTSVLPMTGYEQAVGKISTPEQMLNILEVLGLAGAGGNLEGVVIDGDPPLNKHSGGNQIDDTPEEATEHGGALQSSDAWNKPCAVYISDDKKQGKAHSEHCAHGLEVLKWFQIACQPYIFLFIARPETVLTSNGKAFAFTSPALKAVFKVHHAEEHAQQLAEERAQTAAALAESAQL
ncbi:hypothetical protein PAXRUDRAFT_28434 [Paxillus rubicundulus Ve08.2h10]|uniref:Uncharacterized protein n=1 Tax=Paxillus rubicundulus Ve08.2h10 TaxID=930991 RepID=A0A0D0C8X5_9AGAM|nr:hypothetical protein PAXRUDRAFT_28434 [Paxillus rubicundulus Ve08.2h10]